DGVMVARGDLGVEVSVQEVPYHQKRIIRLCNRVGVPVITATQMLQSMVTQPRPTRAEASDVANAVLDGTDAVMLSAETAIGAYPVRSAEMLMEIAQMTETRLLSWEDPFPFQSVSHEQPITDAISDATVRVAEEIDAKLIVTSTFSGYTARQIARERPDIPIVAVTPDPDIRRRLALSWGVQAFVIPETETAEHLLAQTNRMVIEARLAAPGDLIVLTGGFPVGGGGRTNFLRVHRLVDGNGIYPRLQDG
ncbi:pyruvate kinase, partial [Candidatus Bipolaricaulota bacterium]|nr:pyruvate kinase [Candidatus Bipolaricaulota bacterium]